MEKLVILLIKLALQLAWVVLRFAVRVVLFAWSGDWHKLDKLEAQLREALAEARKETKPVRPARPPRAPKSPGANPRSVRAQRSRPRASTAAPWPFDFPSELTELEPEQELQGGETTLAREPARVARAVPSKRVPAERPAARAPLPMALALRQPRMVHDAMVLTALLGPRGRRDRRF